jgi:hypothetical protein
MLDVIAVIGPSVREAATLEVELEIAVALVEVVSPPFFAPLLPPVCDGVDEASVLVTAGWPSR